LVTFNFIFIVGIFIFLLMALLTYTSRTSISIKALVLPLLLLIGILTFEHYSSLLGAPITARPVGEFAYIHHEIVDAITGNPAIVIWVFDREVGNRLYLYPYNRDDAEKLNKAQSNRTAGNQKVILKFGDLGSPGIEFRPNWTIKGERFIKQ